MGQAPRRDVSNTDAYRLAGVNITAGNEAVERMKKHVQTTLRPEVMAGLGGFGALFRLDTKKYQQPVLVSGSDGVGTKLKLAFAMDKHDTIGIDAVAMCVNDIAVQGAEPLFFLDYLACGQVIPEKIEQIVAGVAEGCRQAGCALIGGETAEMPGMYQAEEYDIAGFAVGVVEESKLIDGHAIQASDVLIGLPSSGLHSNGFSLVRKLLLEQEKMPLHQKTERLDPVLSLGEMLLTPTRIYVGVIRQMLEQFAINGLVHITGGGFIENIPRILPQGLGVEVDLGNWPVPEIFTLLQEVGELSTEALYRTFNMGIGMVMIVAPEEAPRIMARLKLMEEPAYLIGRVSAAKEGVHLVDHEAVEKWPREE